ncbi:TnsA endonuclease N-terminal domain-containing protein [Pseudomonas aeruginosa]|uniref:TnsA endonuclease N-terminal domain-containing protein n=1 Tax=Pseudomonas aeruginosa TaxID=287 RepID=UPI001ABCC96C|nr:TnsA endonuclease N-terminal domain-containing protein [Pseudomonas aeruginosa]
MNTQLDDGMRRIPLSRRSHITGFQPVRHKAVEHESALERDFVLLTQFRDPAAELVSQPETIHFMDAGKHRRYTPDFLVLWSDGRRELVEIKYRTDLRTQWSNLRPAFAAARDWAHANGATFRIATERGIRGMELENALRLIPLRSAPLDVAACDAVLSALKSLRARTIGQLVSAARLERPLALATIWRMLAQGRLLVDDLSVALLASSPVRAT